VRGPLKDAPEARPDGGLAPLEKGCTAMTKFQCVYNSADVDVAHLTIDDVFDITLIRRETGIEIEVLDDYNTPRGSFCIDNPKEA
jgi:hypothetical protein